MIADALRRLVMQVVVRHGRDRGNVVPERGWKLGNGAVPLRLQVGDRWRGVSACCLGDEGIREA